MVNRRSLAPTIVLAVMLPTIARSPAFCADELFYILNAKMNGASSTILVNGVPIAECKPERKPCGGTGAMLNPWMKTGENELLVFMPKVRGNLSFKLYAGHDGEPVEKLKPLISFDINDYRNTTGPLSKKILFTPKGKFPALEVWSKTRPVKLDEKAKTEIRTLVLAYAKAVATLNPNEMAGFLDFSMNEYNRATYEKVQSRPAIARKLEKEMTADLRKQKARMQPVDPSSLEFKPVAGGRMVKVTGKGERDPIEFISNGAVTTSLEIYVGYVGGEWIIVR